MINAIPLDFIYDSLKLNNIVARRLTGIIVLFPAARISMERSRSHFVGEIKRACGQALNEFF